MNDVIFRRVRGRIVPIKVSKKAREGGKGAALIGAGAAVAAGSGHLAGKAIHAAAKAENLGRTLSKTAQDLTRKHTPAPSGQMSFPGMESKPRIASPKTRAQISAAMRSSTSAHIKSDLAFRASSKIGSLGKIAGGVLIGSGLTKLYESVTGKKAGLKEDIAANVTGQVVTSAFDVGLASAVRTGGNLRRAIEVVLKSKLKL